MGDLSAALPPPPLPTYASNLRDGQEDKLLNFAASPY